MNSEASSRYSIKLEVWEITDSNKTSENLQRCPICNNYSLVKDRQEPFFDITKPDSISVTYWKCKMCKYERMDSVPYN